MLSSLSRSLRLALLLALSVGVVAWKGHHTVAFAANDDDGGDEEGGDDDGGGSDDGGGAADDGGGGGDDDGSQDKDQPPVTAGGLYTMATYPVRENSRPLTITQKIGQLRLGLGTDLSAKGAFESFGVNLEGIYGVHDNFQVIGGFTNAYNMKQFGAYFGFEGALLYDIVDFRLAANLHRNALPGYSVFCNPPGTPSEMPSATGTCMNGDASHDLLPNGKFTAGGTKLSIDIGFPFRYAVRPEIAIVALQTLMSIDFNSVKHDYVTVGKNTDYDENMPMTSMNNPLKSTSKPNGAKPDLNPSIGIATNPIPPLSVTIFAQLRIPDFDTSAGAFQIPVTGRFEFSPNQKFDVGLEFTLLNVKPPEGQSPIDNRYLSLFVQSRFGR